MQLLNNDPTSKTAPPLLNPKLVFFLFLVLTVGLRLSSFFASAIGWDEGLYVLIADQWLKGHLPYTEVWDNKPVGIYAIFAAALWLGAHSLIAIRIAACIFVAAAAYILYRIGRLLHHKGDWVGLAAGCFYTAIPLNYGGMSANTEIFLIPFSLLGLYCLLLVGQCDSTKGKLARLAVAGLSYGLAFEIKYVAVFDVLAGLLLVALTRPFSFSFRSTLTHASRALVLVVAMALPFLLTTAAFAVGGHFGEYWAANITANHARTVQNSFQWPVFWSSVTNAIGSGRFLWFCAAAGTLALVLRKRWRQADPDHRFIVGVGLAVLLYWACLAAVFRTWVYDHYLLQMIPWLSLLLGILLVRLVSLGALGKPASRARLLTVAGIAVILLGQQSYPHVLLGAKQVYFRFLKGRQNWLDEPARVAAHLAPQMKDGDSIYVVDDEPIIYFLTHASLPSRFVFPPLLVRRIDMPDIAGVKPLEELRRIMDSRPRFIVKRHKDSDNHYVAEDQIFFSTLRAELSRDYEVEQSFDGLDVYRLNTTSPARVPVYVDAETE